MNKGMTSLLLRTKTAVEDCTKHIVASGAQGSEIEAYLTQHLLVIMCAEVEQAIHSILEKRLLSANDPDLCRFAMSSGQRVLRSIKKGELAGFVGRFGDHAQRKFDSLLEEKEVSAYNNAVQARHDIAHQRGALISYSELVTALNVAEKVLGAVREAINHKNASGAA